MNAKYSIETDDATEALTLISVSQLRDLQKSGAYEFADDDAMAKLVSYILDQTITYIHARMLESEEWENVSKKAQRIAETLVY